MYQKENNWLLSHPEVIANYPGEYIAIVGESVVAHGKDFKKVLEEAEKAGKEPLVHKVPFIDKEVVV
jgi:hypothetical protein